MKKSISVLFLLCIGTFFIGCSWNIPIIGDIYDSFKKQDQVCITYTNDKSHKVKSITTPEGFVEVFYDNKNNIAEIKIDNYHIKNEYNTHRQPTKIILVGKGEITTVYNRNHEIVSVKATPYYDSITEHVLRSEIHEAMSILTQRSSLSCKKKVQSCCFKVK